MILARAIDEEVGALDERHASLGRLWQQRIAINAFELAPEEVATLGCAEGEAVAEVRIQCSDERVLACLQLRARTV